ncbi:MAG TPA: hypothetical protein V6D27_01040 [Vampirovibrionales bacterium]
MLTLSTLAAKYATHSAIESAIARRAANGDSYTARLEAITLWGEAGLPLDQNRMNLPQLEAALALISC